MIPVTSMAGMDRDEVSLDYISADDTSIDSDELLTTIACRYAARNAFESKGWKGWHKKENVPRRHGFSGTPGLKDGLSLEEDSTPKEILDCFFFPLNCVRLWRETKPIHSAGPAQPIFPHEGLGGHSCRGATEVYSSASSQRVQP